MHMRKSSVLVAAATFVLALAPFTAYAQDSAPTDPQIAQVVQTANRIDIDQAKLALKKTKNPQVKEFANQIISYHPNLQKSVNDLGKKLNVTPQGSPISKQVKQ